MVELVDTPALGAGEVKLVEVQVLSAVPKNNPDLSGLFFGIDTLTQYLTYKKSIQAS